MDYEKKYKEALATARKLYNMRGDWTNLEIESIFPELRECKDERIRKEILDYIIKGSESCYDVQQYGRGKFEKWIAWLEKQGEQKPAWSEEGEKILKEVISNYESGFLPSVIERDRIVKTLKSIKDRVQPQLEQDFTDDDKEQIKKISEAINNYYPYKESSEMRIWLNSIKDRIEWLKSIISRQQQKQEWSEEDKTWFDEVWRCVSKEYPLTNSYIFQWLKSIKPQSQWKPSEEMLKALYRAIPENTMAISEDEMLLDKLYQGLKYGKVLSEK